MTLSMKRLHWIAACLTVLTGLGCGRPGSTPDPASATTPPRAPDTAPAPPAPGLPEESIAPSLAWAGAAPHVDEESIRRMTPAERAVLAEFLEAASRLESENALFVGASQVAALRTRLEATPEGTRAAIDLRDQLGREQLRLGDNVEALAEMQKALEQERAVWAAITAAGAATGEPGLQMQRLRDRLLRLIIAALRVAETGNCVARHVPTSCILPLRPEAVHSDRIGAETAMSYAREYLELAPDDLKGIWFLNLAAMQAGVWPDGVPERWRIPPSRFTSAASLGEFPNVASSLGLDVFSQAGGSVTEDFDGDGFIDVLTSTMDPRGPLSLFRNAGDGTFVPMSRAARLDSQLGGLNLMQTDYNNDGRADLLVVRGGWLGRQGRVRKSLLRNNPDGTFTDVTAAAGLVEPVLPTQTAAWADIEGDGDLDLYVGHEGWEGPDGRMTFQTATLYRNEGNGTFTDITAAAGVSNDRFAKGVAFGDYDGDGDPDIYVSNIGPNRLYRNNGIGTFTDVAPELGVTEPAGRSFATWFFDYDLDGDLDLFVAAYLAEVPDVAADLLGRPPKNPAIWPRLYRNDGGRFADVTGAAGLAHAHLPMGANFGDLNEDGYPDIYLGTGAPAYEMLMPNVLYLNNGDGTFTDVTFSAGVGHLQKGHGVSFADLDNDGDQDLFHQLGGFFPGDKFTSALFLNPGRGAPGHGKHFLSVRAIGTRSNRAAIGARLRVRVATPTGERDIYRMVGTGGSFGASSLEQSIGLGDGTAIRLLEIDWPHRAGRQTFTDVPIDSFVRLTQDSARLEVVERRRLQLARP